jgi:hypothetical protein
MAQNTYIMNCMVRCLSYNININIWNNEPYSAEKSNTVPPEDGAEGPKHVVAKIKKSLPKG